MSETVRGLTALLDQSRQELLEALAGIQQSQEVFPGWQVRHFLAHITGWDEATTISLKSYLAGDIYEIPAYRGIDDFNEQTVETRKLLAYDQVHAEWKYAREALKEAVSALTDEQVGHEMLFPWGERGTIETLIKIMVHHELAHSHDIRAIQKAQ